MDINKRSNGEDRPSRADQLREPDAFAEAIGTTIAGAVTQASQPPASEVFAAARQLQETTAAQGSAIAAALANAQTSFEAVHDADRTDGGLDRA